MPIYHANCIYGYFQKDVPVFVSKRLAYQPHAQAGVIADTRQGKRWFHLMSYESLIFSYCPDDNTICFDWSTASPDYSRTTVRHVSSFCKEYVPCMSYQSIKKLYYDSKAETPCKYVSYI